MIEFEKVICPDPKCNRTISHYIKGSGTDSIFRNTCPKCGKVVWIYSAGRTALSGKTILTETIIEINIT